MHTVSRSLLGILVLARLPGSPRPCVCRLKVTPGLAGRCRHCSTGDRRRAMLYRPSAHPALDMPDDHDRTRKDIRAALIVGIIAATIEMGVLLYFFR